MTVDTVGAQRAALTNWFQCASPRKKNQNSSRARSSHQPPSSAGSKRRKSDSSGGPSGAARRHTASSYGSLRRGRGILVCTDSARTAERLSARSIPTSSGDGEERQVVHTERGGNGKRGELAFKVKAAAEKAYRKKRQMCQRKNKRFELVMIPTLIHVHALTRTTTVCQQPQKIQYLECIVLKVDLIFT